MPSPLPRRDLLTLALLAGCAPLPAGPAPQGDVRLQVVRRDWHTDVALPPEGLPGAWGADLRQRFPGARLLVFGYGDRAHVGAGDPGLDTMLAALLPGPAAMLVTGLRQDVEAAFGPGSCVTLAVPGEAALGVRRFVQHSFTLDAAGRPEFLGDGPYPGGVHYAATGRYSAFNTCNTWTARALAAGGLPLSPRGVVTAEQVMAQLAILRGRG